MQLGTMQLGTMQLGTMQLGTMRRNTRALHVLAFGYTKRRRSVTVQPRYKLCKLLSFSGSRDACDCLMRYNPF